MITVKQYISYLRIGFKKAYYSVTTEASYYILTEFGISMKLVRLINWVSMKPTTESG
jgi:hypothetical protein